VTHVQKRRMVVPMTIITVGRFVTALSESNLC
jgi:hypothetical protein